MTPSQDKPAPKAPAELPSYSLEEEEAPGGWRRWLRGRRLAVLSSAITIAAIVLLSAKPLYREAKARRALSLADQAGQAVDHGDAAEASRLLRQAALMAFQDERVAALVTLHAARSGDAASVAELGKKVSSGKASPEEALVYGEMSLAAGRLEEAEHASELVERAVALDKRTRSTALRAGVMQARQRGAEAEEILRAALAETPGESSDRLRIMLAGLLLAKGNEASSVEAEELLEQAAAGTSEQGAAALRVLCANRAGISPEARESFERTAERLRSHPAAKQEDEIFIARIGLSSDPSRARQVARAFASRLNGAQPAPIDIRAAAARLLVSANCLDEVLDLVSEEDSSTHAGALMARLDALSGLEDWDQTSRLIEKNRGATLPDTLYYLFRARLALVKGDAAAAEDEKRLLRQVMPFAELPHVLFAARYAENVGWKPEALAAWRILAANENARADALRAQLRNLPADAPAAEGLSITDELLKLFPNDPSIRLSSAYFRLLAGRDIESSVALAEEFLAADPASVDIRRVTALARLRAGRADSALAIWPGDADENRWRALHAALLRESGRAKDAEAAAAQVDRELLGPEEKDLLSGRGTAHTQREKAEP